MTVSLPALEGDAPRLHALAVAMATGLGVRPFAAAVGVIDQSEGALPAESEAMRHAVPARRAEFATGRRLAARALREIGIADTEVPRGAAGEPLWPPGVTGSISHSSRLCIAVASRTGAARGLGVDVEQVGALEPELWASVCSTQELLDLSRLPVASQPLYAGLLFSAKEASFKAQFPLTGEVIDFADVSVRAVDGGVLPPRGGGFRIVPEPAAVEALRAAPTSGLVERRGDWILSLSRLA